MKYYESGKTSCSVPQFSTLALGPCLRKSFPRSRDNRPSLKCLLNGIKSQRQDAADFFNATFSDRSVHSGIECTPGGPSRTPDVLFHLRSLSFPGFRLGRGQGGPRRRPGWSRHDIRHSAIDMMQWYWLCNWYSERCLDARIWQSMQRKLLMRGISLSTARALASKRDWYAGYAKIAPIYCPIVSHRRLELSAPLRVVLHSIPMMTILEMIKISLINSFKLSFICGE
jgi:hypothetical protein